MDKKKQLMALIKAINSANTMAATLQNTQVNNKRALIKCKLVLHPDKAEGIDKTLVKIATEAMNKLESAFNNDEVTFSNSKAALKKYIAAHSQAAELQPALQRPTRPAPARPRAAAATALFYAATRSNKALFAQCIKAGANINQERYTGSGPAFLYAAMQNHNFDFALWVVNTYSAKINFHPDNFKMGYSTQNTLMRLATQYNIPAATELALRLTCKLTTAISISASDLERDARMTSYLRHDNAVSCRFELYTTLLRHDKINLTDNGINTLLQHARHSMFLSGPKLSTSQFCQFSLDCLAYIKRHHLTMSARCYTQLLHISSLDQSPNHATLLKTLLHRYQITHYQSLHLTRHRPKPMINIDTAISNVTQYFNFIESTNLRPERLCTAILLASLVAPLKRNLRMDYATMEQTLKQFKDQINSNTIAQLMRITVNLNLRNKDALITQKQVLCMLIGQLPSNMRTHIDTKAMLACSSLESLKIHTLTKLIKSIPNKTSVSQSHATTFARSATVTTARNGAGGGAGATYDQTSATQPARST